ncbi:MULTISPECIES: ribonuclease HIII [unclassified Mycoplasma]|uniref:ribonuclease HIII n=1 Tax=unclassified Mycoplasma TaxID=2683645 RepID=UPI00211CEDE1|nr:MULTISPECIES: ribonuclease HIII [unclassified Mycoplasma]UUM19846.1 ribonuclease HIII [Mycoplasma sp. 1578d]UUM24830.1 ribonuclease HIII [Mycoplasma sp. 3686d]
MKYIELVDKKQIKELEIIGIDETGVSDYFTPLIACAFYLPRKLYAWAKSIGVEDSKKLSKSKIIQIGNELKNNNQLAYSVYRLKQSTYNKLNQKYNTNELKFFTHMGALNNLNKKISFTAKNVLIDKYSTTKSILKYHNTFFVFDNWTNIEEKEIDVYLTTKAESISLSVACASIMARYELINYMEQQNKEWNFSFPLGAGTKTQEYVYKFAQIFGEDKLNQVCKTNMKLSIRA